MPQSPEIIKEIETLAASKNPLSVLLSVAKIREMVLELGDGLVNSIESSYYDDTATKFFKLTDRYREAWYYKIMYAHYVDTGRFRRQKAYLDGYFEESYYRDPDFFFFILEKHPLFRFQFSAIKWFVANPDKAKKYGGLLELDKKTAFILKSLPEITKEDGMGIHAATPMTHEFLTAFWNFPFASFPEFSSNRERVGRSPRLLVRDLYFTSLRSEENPSGPYHAFWKGHYADNSFVRSELIDSLPNDEVLDAFSYLRTKFMKTPKYNVGMTTGNVYQKLIESVRKLEGAGVLEKLNFVRELDSKIGMNPIYRERGLNILRKSLMYDNSMDMVDVLFGISFVNREVFYEIKRRTAGAFKEGNPEFAHLDNVKSLAILLDSSFLMRLIRPFLIERLARMFNKKADTYYFVKFLLAVHSTDNYKEYKTLIRFFIALEAHSKTGAYWFLLRNLQFGWVYFALAALFFIAPLGAFLAILGVAVARLGRHAMEKRFPEMSLNSNFQMTGFLTVFAVLSTAFGLSFARADNVSIVYGNFRTAINAVSMVASESATLIVENAVMKNSAIESGTGAEGEGSPLSEIDYVNGKEYRNIRR